MAVDTSAHSKHVIDIERMIHTFKDCLRALRASLPYHRVPKKMIIEAVTFTNLWLNVFPSKEGVSTTYSPRNVLLGNSLSHCLHCRIPFGAYDKVHDAPELSNLPGTPQTTPVICLGPTGNARSSYKFLNLCIKHVILRYQFTEIPATSASHLQWTRQDMSIPLYSHQ